MPADFMVEVAIAAGMEVATINGVTWIVHRWQGSVRQVIVWADDTCTVWREAAVPSAAELGRPMAPLLAARFLGMLPAGFPPPSDPLPFLGLPRRRRSERPGRPKSPGPRAG